MIQIPASYVLLGFMYLAVMTLPYALHTEKVQQQPGETGAHYVGRLVVDFVWFYVGGAIKRGKWLILPKEEGQ